MPDRDFCETLRGLLEVDAEPLLPAPSGGLEVTKRHSENAWELQQFLRNHADAILRVVKAARDLTGTINYTVGMNPNDRGYGPGNKIADALAALEERP